MYYPIETALFQTPTDGSMEKKLPKSRQRIKQNSRILPTEAIEIMTRWYENHYTDPYPSFRDYEYMSKNGNITVNQAKQWFVNVRRRTKNQFRRQNVPYGSKKARNQSESTESFSTAPIKRIKLEDDQLPQSTSNPAYNFQKYSNQYQTYSYQQSSYQQSSSPTPSAKEINVEYPNYNFYNYSYTPDYGYSKSISPFKFPVTSINESLNTTGESSLLSNNSYQGYITPYSAQPCLSSSPTSTSYGYPNTSNYYSSGSLPATKNYGFCDFSSY